MSLGIYKLTPTGKPFKACGGNVGDANTGESCAVVTELPGGGVELADSKLLDLGLPSGVIRLDAGERAALKAAL